MKFPDALHDGALPKVEPIQSHGLKKQMQFINFNLGLE